MANGLMGNQTVLEFLFSTTTNFVFGGSTGNLIAAGLMLLIGFGLGYYVHYAIFEF